MDDSTRRLARLLSSDPSRFLDEYLKDAVGRIDRYVLSRPPEPQSLLQWYCDRNALRKLEGEIARLREAARGETL